MTSTTVPYPFRGRGRRAAHGVFFMTDDRPARRRRRSGRGWGPRGHGGPSFGGRRARRGNIRTAIVTLLAEKPMHGYEIMSELAERSGGVWRPSPGSVYPTLQQLEDEGLVEPAESESGRRVFQLTDAGEKEASAQTGPAPWDAVGSEADDAIVELRELVMQVLAATRQVGQAGTARQISAAQDVLRSTRKSLYRLLAEDDKPENGEST
jgi:DNA-binding PadR family transcriptional regulator